ncbi:MAG: zinc ABC transporter substrate-binding protein [Oscillospiraceae bacterium]|nr:zinc ABC transporter substrate-binding protein [Oscillospiraceae bacterium]
MKKAFVLLLCFVLAAGALTGCGGEVKEESGKISVVATIFPEYDWVMNILGDKAENADVTLLLDGGVDMHSYQPTVDDIVLISECDLFIYVGGESDAWVTDALERAKKDDGEVVSLFRILSDKVVEEELAPGMEAEEEEEEEAYDEHVWLSVKNAEIICRELAARLGDIDPANAKTYSANAEAYIEKLSELDGKYEDAVKNGVRDTLLFGDRFPFRYMTDDYGLEYYAAFPGCSAETEASFETVVLLSGVVDDLSLPCVLTIETGDGKLAQTIIDNTKSKSAEILQMDSMQSVTAKDIAGGETYIGIMEHNLSVLEKALA